MYVYIVKRIFQGVKDKKCVINIHTMGHVVYFGFSKRQIITKEVFFCFALTCLCKVRR